MKNVYLDYASTTPVDPEVTAAMMPYFSDAFGNPGAMHKWGQEAQAAVDGARARVADFLGCDFDEVIFTGSATEANNLAIRGAIKQNARRPTSRIVTSAIEHKSIFETFHDLKRQGIEVAYIPVTSKGLIRREDIAGAVKEKTVFISIGYVNSEIGAIQPIPEISKAVKQKNNNAIFHTDAVQAANYLDCSVKKLGVDLLTFSGHKIYGPKGIGVLYIKKGVPLSPVITGGGQEYGVRSGTENVPAIVGLGKAVELVAEKREKEAARVQKLRDCFIGEVLGKISGSELNGSEKERIPNNASFFFPKIPATNLLIALDREGVGASAGSTCTIKTVTPSHVIMALGKTKEKASQSVRFTLGRETTKKDIEYTVGVLQKIVTRF